MFLVSKEINGLVNEHLFVVSTYCTFEFNDVIITLTDFCGQINDVDVRFLIFMQ